ncbi:MAG: hypothetical protein RLZZ292_491 [Bacteroidota bacterium]|jgi:hypothetical protein
MQKIILLVALCCATIIANAQNVKASKVPAAVKSAFKAAYPTVQKAHWSMEDKTDYEVGFDNAQGKDVSVVISPSGVIKETEVEIAFSDLPVAAQTALKGKKVKETAKITDANGNVKYEAEVKGKDLLFDASGASIK